MSRYSRQISVKSVGQRGHLRVRNGSVKVYGSGLDSQVCALYLAGAGVGTIFCHSKVMNQVQAINSEIKILEISEDSTDFRAVCGKETFRSKKTNELGRGSQVARDVIACFLREQ